MSYQNILVHGNIFYCRDSVNFVFFHDIDDCPERLEAFRRAEEAATLGAGFTNRTVFPSRNHQYGHVFVNFGEDWWLWARFARLTNIHEYWENQAIKFLRVSPYLAKFESERHLIPAIYKFIHPVLKYQSSSYYVTKPSNDKQLRLILEAREYCANNQLLEKITGPLFDMLCIPKRRGFDWSEGLIPKIPL